MVRSDIGDMVKVGGLFIAFLVTILTLSTFTFNVGDLTKNIETLIIIMLILSIVTAIANFFKKF